MSQPQSNRLPDGHNSDVKLRNVFQIEIDETIVEVYPGQTIAAVLLACGKRIFNYAPDGTPRSYVCGIGRCFNCLVTVNDEAGIRACKTFVQPGMKILTGLQEMM